MIKKIFVTGGGGYVGSSLVDKLVEKNYSVSVLDLFIYGQNVFSYPDKINIIKGDIRDVDLLKRTIVL